MPAYSKGCRTCVKRKIKCDERRPACLRCEQSHLQCDGPPPPAAAKFLDETDRVAARVIRKQRRSMRSVSKLNTNLPANLTLNMISPSAYSLDAYTVFFLDRIFQFGTWNVELQNNRAWIYDALQSPTDKPVSNTALRCLAFMIFGRVNRDQSLQDKSFHLYGEALTKLSDVLSKGQNVSFDVLSAVLLLQFFELSAFTNHKGWMQHTRALRNLIRLAGPEYFRTEPAKSLMTWSRYSLLTESSANFKRDFMERPEWQALLQPEGNDNWVLGVRLTNIAYKISGLQEDIDAKPDDRQHFTDDQEILQTALTSLKRVEVELNGWFAEWNADPRRLPIRTTDTPSDLSLKPLGSTFLRFSNLDAAAVPCRYHAHMILLLISIGKIEAKLAFQALNPGLDGKASQSPSYLERNEQFQSRLEQIQQHVDAIFEALPFYCLPQYVYIGATYVGLPAVAAWCNLPKGSAKANWIERMLQRLAEQSGFESAKYVLQDFGQ